METFIHEPVDVLASFKEREVLPRRFRWKGRALTISALNLTYRVRDGAAVYRYFSVSAEGGVYLLRFDPVSLRWELEAMYGEG